MLFEQQSNEQMHEQTHVEYVFQKYCSTLLNVKQALHLILPLPVMLILTLQCFWEIVIISHFGQGSIYYVIYAIIYDLILGWTLQNTTHLISHMYCYQCWWKKLHVKTKMLFVNWLTHFHNDEHFIFHCFKCSIWIQEKRKQLLTVFTYSLTKQRPFFINKIGVYGKNMNWEWF